MGEWLEIAKATATGIAAALPIIGALVWFHRERSAIVGERFDRLDEAHDKLAGKVDRLDNDMDGLVRQISGIVTDVEQRFLTREEHTAAVNRLDGTIVELNRNFGRLNDHLFDLARDRSTREPK